MSILIFGFEPFLEFDENPSQLIVNRLEGTYVSGHDISGVVLPVDYSQIEERIVSAIRRVRPSLAVGFGLAPGREKFTPEKIAVNYRSAYDPDNTGRIMNGTPIDPSQPDGIFTNLPVENLVEKLNNRGIPSLVSLSAGAYLCNNAMFVIVREARKHGFGGGFIHIPCHSEWIARNKKKDHASLPFDTILEASVQSLTYYLEQSKLLEQTIVSAQTV